jgi:hypothetical protein
VTGWAGFATKVVIHWQHGGLKGYVVCTFLWEDYFGGIRPQAPERFSKLDSEFFQLLKKQGSVDHSCPH